MNNATRIGLVSVVVLMTPWLMVGVAQDEETNDAPVFCPWILVATHFQGTGSAYYSYIGGYHAANCYEFQLASLDSENVYTPPPRVCGSDPEECIGTGVRISKSDATKSVGATDGLKIRGHSSGTPSAPTIHAPAKSVGNFTVSFACHGLKKKARIWLVAADPEKHNNTFGHAIVLMGTGHEERTLGNVDFELDSSDVVECDRQFAVLNVGGVKCHVVLYKAAP